MGNRGSWNVTTCMVAKHSNTQKFQGAEHKKKNQYVAKSSKLVSGSSQKNEKT